MSGKICKAIITEIQVPQEDGTTIPVRSFAPEHPELVGDYVNIHPDEDGVQWYWTLDAPIAP